MFGSLDSCVMRFCFFCLVWFEFENLSFSEFFSKDECFFFFIFYYYLYFLDVLFV